MAEGEGPKGRGPDRIYGRRPVSEALRASLPLSHVYVQDSLAERMPLRELVFRAKKDGIPVSRVPRSRLDREAAGGVHQGVMAVVAAARARDESELDQIVERAGASSRVVILDGVQDPHNLGAIVRVADATGMAAVVVPRRGSAPLSPVAMKASAGALAWHPVVFATNLSRMIDELKALGFFVWAAVPDGRVRYDEVDWSGRVALVLGGEGSGIRPLVLRHADETVRLPMAGRIQSLNVGTAAAVFAFEMLRQTAPGPKLGLATKKNRAT